jgi:hypothetical protein
MPITNSAQDWSVGSIVQVGFLSLKVERLIPTPGDYRPDIYVLSSSTGKLYEFVPHHGLERIWE